MSRPEFVRRDNRLTTAPSGGVTREKQKESEEGQMCVVFCTPRYVCSRHSVLEGFPWVLT